MKAIEIKHCQTGAVTSRADGGVKISFVTPELRPSEAGVLIQMHGKNVCVSIVPEDVAPDEVVRVETEREQKTPGSRLRAVLFVLFREKNPPVTFTQFYDAEMEKIINEVKALLP